MCRNIKTLRNPERPPTDEELHDAALQFVRKVSGYRAPSKANEAVFGQAVETKREIFQRSGKEGCPGKN